MSITQTLSTVATAIAGAPKGTDTSLLREFCSNHKVSNDELDAMIARGCTDQGAIRAALGELKTKAPAKKKAKK